MIGAPVPEGFCSAMETMKSLRISAYVFAVAAISITVPLTIAADDEGIAVALLGGTLAVTPYVVVRAFEEVTRESVPSPRN
jgi:hypothetical protein